MSGDYSLLQIYQIQWRPLYSQLLVCERKKMANVNNVWIKNGFKKNRVALTTTAVVSTVSTVTTATATAAATAAMMLLVMSATTTTTTMLSTVAALAICNGDNRGQHKENSL